MEEEEDHEAPCPSPIVFFSPPSPSPIPRRLSATFSHPTPLFLSPSPTASRLLSPLSLHAHHASSSSSFFFSSRLSFLSPQLSLSWDLFSPIHRILIVAVVAVATSNSYKDEQISRLKKSVHFRDQVLSSMQQKLDNLCDQLNYFKDQPESVATISIMNQFPGCGSQLSDQHKLLPANSWCKTQIANSTEPEERRMSDLSDWAPSVSSSVDFQLSSSAIEQDNSNLRKECEEKDATIKNLSGYLCSSEARNSKVVSLIRLGRPSFSASSSNTETLPVMADNLLYDMDTSTSPSSSDSECPSTQAPASGSPEIIVQNNVSSLKEGKKMGQHLSCTKFARPTRQPKLSRSVSPLKEKPLNQISESVITARTKRSYSANGGTKSRKQVPSKSRAVAPPKRWV